MVIGKEYGPMKKEEIAELLRRKDWSRTKLASMLHVVENTVQKWFMSRPGFPSGGAPDGPASELMRLWLCEARGELKMVWLTKSKRREAVVA
jgi:DNA-binding transcriptional regulator YiaG